MTLQKAEACAVGCAVGGNCDHISSNSCHGKYAKQQRRVFIQRLPNGNALYYLYEINALSCKRVRAINARAVIGIGEDL